MITIFRRVRDKLIASGSVTKYLLYAVGESLLVVVGILIALQVNNWNEDRQLNRQEQTYLGLLRDDLILQKEENDIQKTTLINHISVEEPLTELIKIRFQVKKERRYEAKKILSSLLVGRTYGAYEATFIDLTSSGNIGLISDQVLKNQIIQHYQIQKRDRDVINNNTLNTYLKLFENLAKDENLILIQNVLAFKIAAKKIAHRFLENSDERINHLLETIESEMEAK